VDLSAAKLIEAVRSAGGRFTVDGDRLGVSPRTAAEPFVEDLKRHKVEILQLLRTGNMSDSKNPVLALLPRGVTLLKYAPLPAPIRLSPFETVTDVERFVESALRQLTDRLAGQDFLAGNWTLSTLLERLAAVGIELALDNPRMALQ
jgi:hypothetical protein